MPESVLLHDGVVYSPADPFATAMLVVDDRVAWVGGQGAAQTHADSADRVVRLGGALVTPPRRCPRPRLDQDWPTTAAIWAVSSRWPTAGAGGTPCRAGRVSRFRSRWAKVSGQRAATPRARSIGPWVRYRHSAGGRAFGVVSTAGRRPASICRRRGIRGLVRRAPTSRPPDHGDAITMDGASPSRASWRRAARSYRSRARISAPHIADHTIGDVLALGDLSRAVVIGYWCATGKEFSRT